MPKFADMGHFAPTRKNGPPTEAPLDEFLMSTTKRFTNATGAPVADNTNIMTAGRATFFA